MFTKEHNLNRYALFNLKKAKVTLNMIKFKCEKKIPFQFFNREDGHCFYAQVVARFKIHRTFV